MPGRRAAEPQRAGSRRRFRLWRRPPAQRHAARVAAHVGPGLGRAAQVGTFITYTRRWLCTRFPFILICLIIPHTSNTQLGPGGAPRAGHLRASASRRRCCGSVPLCDGRAGRPRPNLGHAFPGARLRIRHRVPRRRGAGHDGRRGLPGGRGPFAMQWWGGRAGLYTGLPCGLSTCAGV